ncbi:MAG: mechanosensitive ion channel family protein, partial [Bacteroidaceae bacterium]|nr:mechanosensitive ion channel family protein [Bacteroidaceae bacterium]
MRRRLSIIAIILAVHILPVLAVFNEKDLAHTLSVLRFELVQENRRMENSRSRIQRRNEAQHQQMIDMIKKCNELSLILYSQNQDYTFDMTYALQEVTEKYDEFSKSRMPFDEIVEYLNVEVERYERLIESLRRLPPMLSAIDEVPDSLKEATDSLIMTMDAEHMAEHMHEIGMDLDHDGDDHSRRSNMRGMLPGGGGGQQNALNAIAGVLLGQKREEAHGPFMLDSASQVDRDSCIFYARNLLKMYTDNRDAIVDDNQHYADMSQRLAETYDYAQARYKAIQKKIFIKGQDNYLKILSSFGQYWSRAWQDVKQKYSNHDGEMRSHSEWKGPVVAGFTLLVIVYLAIATLLSNVFVRLLVKRRKNWQTPEFRKRRPIVTLLSGVIIFAISVMIASRVVDQNFFAVASSLLLLYAWLLAAIFASALIRVESGNVKSTIKAYMPVIIMGLIIITFRIIFIPNRMVNLFLPPILIVFAFWQFAIFTAEKKNLNRNDSTYSWISAVIMGICAVIALVGYVLMSVQILIWWLFQLTAIATITAFYDLLDKYEDKYIQIKLRAYRQEHIVVDDSRKGAYIEVTWLFDFIKMCLVPSAAIISILISIWFAAGVFDLTEICKTIFYKPFFSVETPADTAIETIVDTGDVVQLSLFKMVLVSCLYFLFKYLSYAIKSFFRNYKLQRFMEESGNDYVHANEVNLTLANNVIGIIVWGIYIISSIVMLNIPMGAISIVAAGLATGIGLAMKDVLNNFIYGIQLMSGRLRVGDYIECDGIRGKVESISYQSTQILTLDGSIMAITNTSLFNEKFKNITRNNSYELVKIPVGVHYGADINAVRRMLTDALQVLCTQDQYGRNIVDPEKGITIAFSDFGDNSVDLIVKQHVLVFEEAAYIASAKEIIYDTLNRNGVEIPFPQRDIYIRQMPG